MKGKERKRRRRKEEHVEAENEKIGERELGGGEGG